MKGIKPILCQPNDAVTRMGQNELVNKTANSTVSSLEFLLRVQIILLSAQVIHWYSFGRSSCEIGQPRVCDHPRYVEFQAVFSSLVKYSCKGTLSPPQTFPFTALLLSFCGYIAVFQNISCFVLAQSIVFHNAAVQNIYNVFYLETSSMCIFNAVKKQSGIGFIVDVLFGYFAYLHGLHTVAELHTNFALILFGRQPIRHGK